MSFEIYFNPEQFVTYISNVLLYSQEIQFVLKTAGIEQCAVFCVGILVSCLA